MVEWWNQQWVRLHAMLAPAGVLATTLLLTYWLGQWQWQWTASVERASGLVEIGAVIYGVIAVAVERGINMIFWALEQRKKRRERYQAELQAEQDRLQAELRAEHDRLRAEGRAAGREEGRAKTAQRYDTWLAKVAEEKGIALAELLPPEQDAA